MRGRLSARRDEAAAALEFEFAARLQAEIEALDWVTAEQKAARSAPEDFDVCGWADGLLVRFTVRGGRLCGWSQGGCDAAAARRLLAGNPAEWNRFAQRNAELAVRLAADSGTRFPAANDDQI